MTLRTAHSVRMDLVNAAIELQALGNRALRFNAMHGRAIRAQAEALANYVRDMGGTQEQSQEVSVALNLFFCHPTRTPAAADAQLAEWEGEDDEPALLDDKPRPFDAASYARATVQAAQAAQAASREG